MEESVAARGADHFAIAWRLAGGGWIGCVLLQFILYLRPSPYGGTLLARWKDFIMRPLAYELLASWLIALPFFLLWLILYRRPFPSSRWRLFNALLIALIAFNLLATQFDHEVYRFLGIRLGPNFLKIYADPSTLGDSLFLNVLRGDRGGPFLSPIVCIAAPSLYLWWAIPMMRRRLAASPVPRAGLRTALTILLLPLAVGEGAYALAHAHFRLSRLEPTLFAVIRDYSRSYEDDDPPGDPAALGRAWQAEWQAASLDRNWRFPDPRRPFLRVPIDPSRPRPDARWNIVLIQLESVRGVDTGHLRPDRSPSPTPYLDSLARAPNAAVWTRALTFGPPSINGRFALQCSIKPSSRRFITSQTQSNFYCLSQALRRQGYRSEMFAAGDIDMDNSTAWVERIYDKLWRYPTEGQRDRPIFRHAVSRIREIGQRGPFLVTLISASNHHPFHSPEPKLDIAGQGSVRERILNSTRYTDDVIREMIESLRSEPWFDRTLFVIDSDHGYNLGEHGGLTGGFSLFRESVWTPLLIVGAHPRLPFGWHDNIVTLLDIAPTLADLLGLREANPWQGHSLLAVRPDRPIRFGFLDNGLTEQGGWTAVTDPGDGRRHLYVSARDWLQRRDLAALHPELARRLLDHADRDRRFNDYIIRHDRLWRAVP